MNFKKILFAILAASFIFTSCKKSADLTDAIPADASYVVHFDMKSLIQKSEYDIFKNPTVQQGINMYKAFMKDQDKVELLDEFMKNPNSIGLDITNDSYFYTNYQTYGIVLGVNNAGKLKDAILKFLPLSETDIQKNGDVNFISPERMATFAWNDNKFILVFDMSSAYSRNSSTTANTQELAIAQLNQDSDKSINSIKSFGEFNKSKKDISVFYNLDGLEKLPQLYGMVGLPTDILEPFNKIISQMKGVSIGMFTSFEKGEITATYDYYFDNSDTEKKFKDLTASMSGKINGDQLKYITTEPLFLASMNLKGQGIYDYLDKLGIMKMITEEYSEAVSPDLMKQIITNFDGDITFSLNTIKEEEVNLSSEFDLDDTESFRSYTRQVTIPECLFFADVKDPDYIKSLIKEKTESDLGKYEEIEPGIYSITQGGIKIYYGVKNKMFFATNMESVYQNLNDTNLKNSYASRSKDKNAFIAGDVNTIVPFVEQYDKMGTATNFLKQFGSFYFTSSIDPLKGEGKVEMTNRDKNSLAVICEQIDMIINNLTKNMGF